MKDAGVLTSRASALRTLERGALRPYEGCRHCKKSCAAQHIRDAGMHLCIGAQFARYVLRAPGKVHDGVNLNRSLCSGN